MLLLIDNFDSFTFNIVNAIQKHNVEVQVVRNNAMTPEECLELEPDYLLIGPGPGTPKDSGISSLLVKQLMGTIPILGVCLGMQLIAEIFGGKVIQCKTGPMHGKTSRIYHSNQGVFSGLDQGFLATRYHSLVVDRESLPPCLKVTAETESGEIMGLAHEHYPLEGVQFHPESILTQDGDKIFDNYLNTITEFNIQLINNKDC